MSEKCNASNYNFSLKYSTLYKRKMLVTHVTFWLLTLHFGYSCYILVNHVTHNKFIK